MSVFDSQNVLVLREVKYKEADRILTLYSSKLGKITAKASGALRKNSKLSASTQMLTYSDAVLLNRDGKYAVTEASIIEPFSGLREDFESYALGCYFADCVDSLCPEGIEDFDILQLILNSLYALSNKIDSPLKIKAAFELRLISLLGYKPDLDHCLVCKRKDVVSPTLGYETGYICCRECRNAEIGVTDYLCDESLNAMRHIVSCSPKSLLSFRAEDESLKRLSTACEDFFISHAERRFGTLDYWKKIKI